MAMRFASPARDPMEWLVQGYGTVRFEATEAAQKAIEDFNGYELEGRTLTVRLDRYA